MWSIVFFIVILPEKAVGYILLSAIPYIGVVFIMRFYKWKGYHGYLGINQFTYIVHDKDILLVLRFSKLYVEYKKIRNHAFRYICINIDTNDFKFYYRPTFHKPRTQFETLFEN